MPRVLTLHDYKLACPSYQFLDHGRLCEACVGGHVAAAALRRCKDGSLGASALLAAESSRAPAARRYDPVDLSSARAGSWPT